MLREGTYVKGRAREVYNGNIVVDVKGSEGPSKPDRGDQRVITDGIFTIEVRYHKGPFRVILGGGLAAGTASLIAAAMDTGAMEVNVGLVTMATLPLDDLVRPRRFSLMVSGCACATVGSRARFTERRVQ